MTRAVALRLQELCEPRVLHPCELCMVTQAGRWEGDQDNEVFRVMESRQRGGGLASRQWKDNWKDMGRH